MLICITPHFKRFIFIGIVSNTYWTRASILVDLMPGSARIKKSGITILQCEEFVSDLCARLLQENPPTLEVALCVGCKKELQLPVQISINIIHLGALETKVNGYCAEKIQRCACGGEESRQIKIAGLYNILS